MSVITLIINALLLLGKFINLWNENDKKKAELKQEALNEVLKGAKDSDEKAITHGFDLFNSVH